MEYCIFGKEFVVKDLRVDNIILDQWAVQFRNNTQIVPLLHPELILGKYENQHFYFNNQVCCDGIPVIVKALFVNPEHDGIWLTIEHDKNKVSIPGGHISDADMRTDCMDTINCTLARELYEEMAGIVYDDGIFTYRCMDPLEYIAFILSKYDLTAKIYNRDLYIDYPSAYDTCIIYMIIEVDIPRSKTIALNTYVHRGALVWYSREDHVLNMTTRRDRRSLFLDHAKDDIRVSSEGVQVLTKIFSQENIFGKLNVY